LSWSPDGRWLVVSRVTSGGESGVFVIAAGDGTVHRLLAQGDASDDYRMAVYSPKGDAVALVNSSFIEVVRIAATDPPTARDAPRRLTTALGFVSGLAWTADGKELVRRCQVDLLRLEPDRTIRGVARGSRRRGCTAGDDDRRQLAVRITGWQDALLLAR
jgi:Tol biopolymer transport system component